MVLLIGAVAAAVVTAHVKFDNGRWVFRGMTIDASGDRSDTKDPINIIFKGHGLTYTNDAVTGHIEDHAGWSGSGPCSSHQRVVWTMARGSKTTSDEDDFQADNVSPLDCFGRRWHLRGWDDLEHLNLNLDHRRLNQWTVVAVHHENRSHKIDTPWDVARRRFIEKMTGHCSWPRWKRHPGARGRNIQGFRNSGWIGRISLRHTSPGDC